MIRQKKTLYEILEISPSASLSEIKSAYETLSGNLKQKVAILGADEVALRQKVLDLAFSTLSVSFSRDAYDAKLINKGLPADADNALNFKVAIDENRNSPLRRVLVVIAGVMVIGLSVQLGFMYVAYKHNNSVMLSPNDAAMQASEKLRVQEYYQEHGVRPGSQIEADLLDAAQRKEDEAQRQKEYEAKERERKYNEFVEESHRIGEKVSSDLRDAEIQASYEEEMRRKQEELDMKKARELEQRRVDAERIRLNLPPSGTSGY